MSTEPNVRKSRIGKLIALGTGVAALLLVTLAIWRVDSNPRTDAAEIDAPLIHVSPSVPGRVLAFKVANNASVKEGDVLFEIDPEPYRLRADLARAELRSAESELTQGERNLSGQKANAAVASEQIARAKENLTLAQQTLDRLAALLPQGFVTAQQVDQARTSRNDARISLEQAELQAKGSSDVIGTLDTRSAQVDAARARLALAERDLRNTVTRAPFTGKITGLVLNAGENVSAGQALFTLINTARWEAVAHFRETDLAHVKPGHGATVFVMSDRTRAVSGTVASIGWGVRSDDGATIAGLPFISRSLNWVRVAKRYPVYIHLHEPPEDLMRVGASAVVILSGEAPHDEHR